MQEPAVDYHMARKPSAAQQPMCQLLFKALQQVSGCGRDFALQASAKARSELRDIRFEP
jgi:hypothetical protein